MQIKTTKKNHCNLIKISNIFKKMAIPIAGTDGKE